MAGTLSSIGLWVWVEIDPGAVAYVARSTHAKPMAENTYLALWCWLTCVIVTVAVSPLTRPKSDEQLKGRPMA